MPLARMVIADCDEEYIRRLTLWFRENKPHQFQITAFTEKESFDKFLRENDSETDVILIGEKFLNPDLLQRGNVILLGSPSALYPNLHCLDKFQPAPVLSSGILALMSAWTNELPALRRSERSELIVCFSPDQRLKSAMALSLARGIPGCLYICFDSWPFYPLQPDTNQSFRNLSDVLYHIKASRGNVAFALESALYSDSSGINYIPPVDNPKDMWELSEKENGQFIESLLSWGRFPIIIADIECNAGPRAMQWLEAASHIILPVPVSLWHQAGRLENMLENLPIRIVSVGRGFDNFPGGIGLSGRDGAIYKHLPWLEEFQYDWKNYSMDGSMIKQLEELLS